MVKGSGQRGDGARKDAERRAAERLLGRLEGMVLRELAFAQLQRQGRGFRIRRAHAVGHVGFTLWGWSPPCGGALNALRDVQYAVDFGSLQP